jgi:hypothetical protein
MLHLARSQQKLQCTSITFSMSVCLHVKSGEQRDGYVREIWYCRVSLKFVDMLQFALQQETSLKAVARTSFAR